MKHTINVTAVLMILFFSSHVIGLFLLNHTIESVVITEQGYYNVTYGDLQVVERPELEGSSSFTYTLLMILIGTVILLLLIRFKLFKVWKAWFFLAICMALLISFSVILPLEIAFALSLLLTYLKLYKPNFYIHNFSEVFMYSGIAILLAPMFTVFWMFMMLIAISLYDAFAVWKSKHMITMAQAQTENRMFAGLLVPYQISNARIKTKMYDKTPSSKGAKSAILGGGDIVFPMLFAGSVMTSLIQNGIPKEYAFLLSLIVSVFAGFALLGLFLIGKKDKFYPAMPFISLGCIVGFGIIEIIRYAIF